MICLILAFTSVWSETELPRLIRSLRGENQRDDESVECECFSENQNEDHPHEDFVLLCVGPHSCVSHNTDSQPCCLRKLTVTRELNPQHSPEAK